MPFQFAEKENTDGLPDGVSEEEFRKIIAAAVADGVVELVREALDDALYITQDGLRVCRFTGKIVDPETDRPRGKK